MNPETPTEQIEKQEEKLGQKGSTIHLPISHNFTLFLIGLIILGTLAYLSYTFLNLGQKERELSQNMAIQTDETAGWKTYRNEEYGFEFKYPGDWDEGVENDFASFGLNHKPNDIPNKLNVYYFKSWQEFKENLDIKESTFVEYIESKKKDYYPFYKLEINFYTWNCSDGSGDGPGDIQSCVTVLPGGTIVVNSFSASNDLINQILSTFKFTNNYDTFDPDGTLSDISVNQVFKDWLKVNKVSWSVVESSDFSTSSTKFGYSYGSGCDTEYGMKLAVSPDKKRSMCFGSGGEPDSDLFLIDKNDNKSTRLAFCGTPCDYQSGFWLDNNKFVFLWAMNDYEYENNMKPYHELHVDMYNFTENIVYSWTTKHLF